MLKRTSIRNLILISPFAFTLLPVTSVMSAEYYVTPDTTAPSGSGTKDTPYNTITAALNAAQPGDAIRLLAGTYVGPVNFPRAGTMDNPIKLVSDGLARSAVIDCQDALVNCVEINHSNIVVDGLEVKNAGYNGIKVDGDLHGSYDAAQSYGRYAGNSSRYNYANGADNIIIQNNYVHNIGYDGIKISHTNNAQILNNEIYKTGTVHFTSSNVWQQGIDAVGVYNSVIRGNYVHDDQVNPIMAHGMFVKGGSENVLIENNIVENIVSPYAAIEVGGDTEWYNTRYTPANVPGLNDRILTQDYNNNEVDMSGTYASATTYTNQYMSEARNCVVRGNLIRNADPALSFRNAYNTKVYNNTVVDSGWGQGWVKLWNDGNKYHRTEQTKLYNNIFINKSVAVNPLGRYRDKSIGTGYDNWIGFEADYNLIYNQGGSTVMGLGSVVTVDSNSIFDTTVLDADYRPTTDAVVVDRGVDLVARGIINVAYADKFGTVVPQGLYDIGAYEYAENASNDASFSIVSDTTAPVVSAFALPSTATSLTVAVSGLTASDNREVAGYLITESATAPAASASGWSATAPSSFAFSAAGSRTAYAWAKDAAGNVSASRSATVTITLPVTTASADTTVPTVSFTSPANGSLVRGTVTVGASASDNVKVTRVLFYLNGALKASDTTAPFSYSWNTTAAANGSYTIMARAYDAAGNVGSTSVAVTVANDTTAPSVSTFSMPATSSTLTVPVSTLGASDNLGVTGYLISESATAPAASATGWSASAPTSFTFSGEGTKTAYAWAKDAAGNVSASRSATVTITLPVTRASADTIAPTVSISSPSSSSTVSGTITVRASASDNVKVTRVMFYLNGALKAIDTKAPYSYSWNTKTAANGSYTLTAKANDAAGNTQQTTVSVTVKN